MSLTHQPELLLKRRGRMMLRLLTNVFVDSLAFQMADGKDTVARLPRENRRASRSVFGPFRCFCFDVLDQFRNRDCSRQADQQMNMIVIAPDRRADTFRFFHMVRKHAKHFILERSSSQEWLAIFCGKDEMQPNLTKRLGHGQSIPNKKIGRTRQRFTPNSILYRDQPNDRAVGPTYGAKRTIPSPLGWARQTAGPSVRRFRPMTDIPLALAHRYP